MLAVLFSAWLLAAPPAAAQPNEDAARKAGVEEKLGSFIDLNTEFRDHNGQAVQLKNLLGRHPAIITPVYYLCPDICPLTLLGTDRVVNEMGLVLGQDFSILTISMDPQETPEEAKQASLRYLPGLKQPGDGWHFLTGSEEAVHKILDQIGFHYTAEGGQFIHSAVAVVITADGAVSRYFYGVSYPAAEMRLALVDAGQGKIGSTGDKFFLYCFHYDQTTGKYTPVIMNIVRLIAGAVFLLLSGLLGALWLVDKRKQAKM